MSSPIEAAKAKLAARWPRLKFEVYEAITGSMNVHWYEGPTAAEVEEELGEFRCYARETRLLYNVEEWAPREEEEGSAAGAVWAMAQGMYAVGRMLQAEENRPEDEGAAGPEAYKADLGGGYHG